MGGRLPEEKLIQECVDSIGTLHHDHVTAVLQDLQEGHEEDLKENAKQGIRFWNHHILYQATTVTALAGGLLTS